MINIHHVGVILFNAIVIGAETEYPDWTGWFFVEQAFLLIFFFELTVRLKRWKLTFFCHPQDYIWNWLDFSIVAGGVFEQWLLPSIGLIESLFGLKMTSFIPSGTMSLIRLARLLLS